MNAEFQTQQLNNDFQACLHLLMEHGLTSNPRGSETKELLNFNITLQNARDRIIRFSSRKTNTQYLLGELIWYLSGSNSLDGILPYSKFWSNITNSGDFDGYEENTVNSNYGNRLFGHNMLPGLTEYSGPVPVESINQWTDTIEMLSKDKDSRQAILNIHLPSDRHAGNKDVACTLTLQFLIREDKLHMITTMRSNDIIRGFTNDIFQFTMLQEIMMLELKEYYPDLELGYNFHNAGSMHIYSMHYAMADNIINEKPCKEISMPKMDVFNSTIKNALISCEKEWRDGGMKLDIDVNKLSDWNDLSEYWQDLFCAMMLKDHDLQIKMGIKGTD